MNGAAAVAAPDLALALLTSEHAHPLGGAVVIAPGVEEAERWVTALRAALAAHRPDAPWRLVPTGVGDDRLVGGLDVTATLAAGARVTARGLLAEADRGLVVVPRAATASAATLARLAAVLDTGSVASDAGTHAARVVAVLVVHGDDEWNDLPALIVDRLALHVRLPAAYLPSAYLPSAYLPSAYLPTAYLPTAYLPTAPARVALADGSDPVLAPAAQLCEVAETLGITSVRTTVLAVRVARAVARAADHAEPTVDDLADAVRLVLAPRAVRAPASAEDPASGAPPTEPPPGAPDEGTSATAADPITAPTAPRPDAGKAGDDAADDHDGPGAAHVLDVLIAAAQAALPPHLTTDGATRRAAAHAPAGEAAGRAQHGGSRPDDRRGRRVGTRPGSPRGGRRLDLVATLRTAAPWQTIRGRAPHGALAVRTSDLRIECRQLPTGTTTIVVVDASGSAAIGRLAEAKGAVELLLAECYARRDRVALVAFRGTTASVLLPPTRALARARRVVSALPAGGGTPLAAALVTAADLARAAARAGARPAVVLLTDGRANIALDGAPGRARAREDAHTAGRALAAALHRAGGLAVVVDTAVRGGVDGRDLAAAASARYLALPHVSARALHGAIQHALQHAPTHDPAQAARGMAS